jgi:uncharacterized hydrophobic protein (TIGR00271 family)
MANRHLKKNPKNNKDIFDYILDLIDLSKGVDYEATVQEINEKKTIYGANAWMLMCSIMIASIGLNTNSQAVIIGAMLISPLMSPILAIGLGVAINDRKTLWEALYHFGISILIAVATSSLFFMISPLKEFTEQIAARTAPTIFDVLIGVFGGIAGIVSIARKDISTTIPGVAIATALMPPLCVTGYGIAIGDAKIAFSSFYLFFINAFFVAFSTYLIIRYLNFPFKEFATPEERKKNMRYVYLFSLFMIIPSLIIFRNVWLEADTKRKVNQFITTHIGDNEIYLDEYEIVENSDKTKTLYLRVWGDVIQRENAPNFTEGLKNIHLRNTTVEILPTSEIPLSKIKEIEEEITNLYSSKSDLKQLLEQQQLLLNNMQKIDSVNAEININDVQSELTTLFPELESALIAKKQSKSVDSIPQDIHLVILKGTKKNTQVDKQKIQDFLKLRINADSIRIILEN